jgi:hypothetical protein
MKRGQGDRAVAASGGAPEANPVYLLRVMLLADPADKKAVARRLARAERALRDAQAALKLDDCNANRERYAQAIKELASAEEAGNRLLGWGAA